MPLNFALPSPARLVATVESFDLFGRIPAQNCKMAATAACIAAVVLAIFALIAGVSSLAAAGFVAASSWYFCRYIIIQYEIKTQEVGGLNEVIVAQNVTLNQRLQGSLEEARELKNLNERYQKSLVEKQQAQNELQTQFDRSLSLIGQLKEINDSLREKYLQRKG